MHNFDAFLNGSALNGIAFETSANVARGAIYPRLFPDGGNATVQTPLSMTGTVRVIDGRSAVRAGRDGNIGGTARLADRERLHMYGASSSSFTNVAKKFALEIADEDLASEGLAPVGGGLSMASLQDEARARLLNRGAMIVNAAQTNWWEDYFLRYLWGSAFAFTDGAFTATEDSALNGTFNPGTKAFEARDFDWSAFFAALWKDMKIKTKGTVEASGPNALKLMITPQLALHMQQNRILNNIVVLDNTTSGISGVNGESTMDEQMLIRRLQQYSGIGEVFIAEHIADTAAHIDDTEATDWLTSTALGLTVAMVGGVPDQTQGVANSVTVQASGLNRSVFGQQFHGMRRNNNNTGFIIEADMWQGFFTPSTSFGQTFYG